MDATKFVGSLLFGLLATGVFAADPPVVYCIKPEVRQIIDYRHFYGHLEPVNKAELRARVSGPITNVHVRIGDQVQKDQLLVEIDPRPYEIGLLQADAALIRAEAQLKRCEVDEQRAKQQLIKGAITPEAYDKLAGEIDIARANVLIEKANREFAKMKLDQTKVRAPFAGRVMSKPKSPGELAKADDTELVQVVVSNEYYVVFELDPYYDYQDAFKLAAWDLKKGCKRVPLEVRLNQINTDRDDYFHTAYFESIEPQMNERNGSQSSSKRARVLVKNPTCVMFPGMLVTLRRQISEPNSACMIDRDALQRFGGGYSVWMANQQNKLEQRQVETGNRSASGKIEIRQGLTKDDRVVLSELPDGWSPVNATGIVPIARKRNQNYVQYVQTGMGISPTGGVPAKPPSFGPTELNDKEIQAGDIVTPIFVAELLPKPRAAK